MSPRLLSPLVVVALALPAAAQQEETAEPKRYRLRETYRAELGDRVAVEASNKTELLVNLKKRGQPLAVENKQSGHEMRYVDEVANVRPDGGVDHIKRTYTFVKDFGTGVIDRRRRTVDLRWGREGFSFDESAELHPTAREQLDAEAERPQGVYDAMIPARPLVVGDRWKIPNEAAAGIFLVDPADLNERSRSGGALHSRVQRGGYDLLRIVFSFDLSLDTLRAHQLKFDEAPLRIRMAFSVWDAYGEPYTSSEFKGVSEGECHYDRDDIPSDVTCYVRVVVSGTHKARRAKPGDDPWH